MIKFFTNRELAQQLGINLAKWKRWSREFLPPDPLGGMQSGYARQYSPDDAFTVFLGGHLVSELKFQIPQAKNILADLHKWLGEHGFKFDIKGNCDPRQGADLLVKKYIISIRHLPPSSDRDVEFQYTARGLISNKPVFYQGFEVMEELYAESAIGIPSGAPEDLDMGTVKILNISGALSDFAAALGIERWHYPALGAL